MDINIKLSDYKGISNCKGRCITTHGAEGHYVGNPTVCICVADSSQTGPAEAYPSKRTGSKETFNGEITQVVESKVKWYALVKSNYYVINVSQNNKTNQYIIASSDECYQTAEITVLPDIQATIAIYGYNEDPKINPDQTINDVYMVKYLVKIDDPQTYTYENLGTSRRKDKETGENIIFETFLIEGVYSKTK